MSTAEVKQMIIDQPEGEKKDIKLKEDFSKNFEKPENRVKLSAAVKEKFNGIAQEEKDTMKNGIENTIKSTDFQNKFEDVLKIPRDQRLKKGALSQEQRGLVAVLYLYGGLNGGDKSNPEDVTTIYNRLKISVPKAKSLEATSVKIPEKTTEAINRGPLNASPKTAEAAKSEKPAANKTTENLPTEELNKFNQAPDSQRGEISSGARGFKYAKIDSQLFARYDSTDGNTQFNKLNMNTGKWELTQENPLPVTANIAEQIVTEKAAEQIVAKQVAEPVVAEKVVAEKVVAEKVAEPVETKLEQLQKIKESEGIGKSTDMRMSKQKALLIAKTNLLNANGLKNGTINNIQIVNEKITKQDNIFITNIKIKGDII